MATTSREEAPNNKSGAGDLLLGKGAEFEGKLTFQGTVRIDAKFTGSITTNDVLVVGEGARISAEISCGTIVVFGHVDGNIKARNAVELRDRARVRGNIETPSLIVEKGVLFHGETKMEAAEKVAPAKAVPALSAATPLN